MSKLTIFYDPHQCGEGKKTKDLVDRLSSVLHREACEPTPYFGEYSNASTLSNIDLVLADEDEARLLCEIEEKGASPKKIIGDIVNIYLADGIMIQGKRRSLNNSRFILGIKVEKNGKSAEKARALERCIQIKIPELLGKLEVVTSENVDELIENVKGKILAMCSNFEEKR